MRLVSLIHSTSTFDDFCGTVVVLWGYNIQARQAKTQPHRAALKMGQGLNERLRWFCRRESNFQKSGPAVVLQRLESVAATRPISVTTKMRDQVLLQVTLWPSFLDLIEVYLGRD